MKAIVVSFFLLLLGLSTIFSYKLWAQQPVEDQFGEVISLNNTSDIVQNLTSTQGKNLVPKGAILGIDDVDTLYYNYIIETEENTDFSVLIKRVVFSKDNLEYQDEHNLLVFDYVTEQISETRVSLTISVSLNMPENKTVYDLICGSSISFQFELNTDF
ncbi:MAG: hypothetical protein JEZ05_08170 [Tenericutes bacterium]|nr:hypothetical protein [Mycoplasmatota bacterium]